MTRKIGTPKKPQSRGKPARIWRLVTNHQNMLYMLASGMVTGPAGYRGKHYTDPLSVYPGWIPLFLDKANVPAGALNQVTSEREYLRPCIASFNLSDLSGPVRMLLRDGRMRDVASPTARRRKDEMAILVRAPLPLTLLSSISFRSSEDRQAFESTADDVSNVDLSTHPIEVEESLFASDTDVSWPTAQGQGQQLEAASDNRPAFGQALGGALAMLYHAANRSDLGLATFLSATGATRDKANALVSSDPILAELPGWLQSGEISGQAGITVQIYWGVIQSLIAAQKKECPPQPVEVALEYLDNKIPQLRDEKSRSRLERLVAAMRACFGLGGGTITELLDRHKGSLSRSLLLFCLRERCTDLLEFSHPLLSDTEYLLAGILFGVRDGWLQLPKELRDPDMSAYVAYRMADAEHRKQGDNLTLDAPPRPKPLRELFTSPSGEWSSMQKDVAIDLASKCNWNDCVQTCITLAEGNYPESFERQGQQVVLPGKVAAVTEEVDKANFMRRLGQWPPMARQIESEVRKKLVSVQEIGEK